jgi:hypothetical protein
VGVLNGTLIVQNEPERLTVMSAGQVTTGSSTSSTVTVRLQVPVLPAPSVAVKVTVELPTGKAEPLAGPPLCVTVGVPQLSVAVGVVIVTTAEHWPGSLFTEIDGGQVTDGLPVSGTVTVKLQLAVLPAASMTVNVLVVVPPGNRDPLAKPAV